MGPELPTFADQQLQAIAATLATASDLVEAAGWATLAKPLALGRAAMGGGPCASAAIAGVIMLNELFGEQTQMGPPNQHIREMSPMEVIRKRLGIRKW